MVQKEPLPIVLSLAAAACAAEFGACFALLPPFNFSLALFLHIVTVAVLALWTLYLGKRGDFRFSLLLALATACVGPFGAVLGFLAIVVYKLGTASALDPSEWIENIFSSHEISERERLQERLESDLDRSAAETGVEPFQDILANGTILQKQMTIAKITRYFHAKFTPLLFEAARNKMLAVRVQAATAVAKIEHDFMARYKRLEKELEKFPGRHDHRIELAQLYDDYAYAGLTDEEDRQSLRGKAIKIYEAHVAQKGDQGLLVRLARLYLRQDQPEKASELLGSVALSGTGTPAAASWYMEALFRQRRLKELRQFAESYAASRGKPAALYPVQEPDEIFRVWNGGANASGLGWEK